MFSKVKSVFMFVDDIAASRDWYARILGQPPTYIDESFAMFNVNGINLCFHLADLKTPVPTGGSVSYWWVEDFTKSLKALQAAGASLYRGPIESEPGSRICQLKDPFGNVFGIEGQAAK
jgi:predicted enzyme related to lactoylglutathione lyase